MYCATDSHNDNSYSNCWYGPVTRYVPVLPAMVGDVDCPRQTCTLSFPGTLLLKVTLTALLHSASQVIISALIAITVTSQFGVAADSNNSCHNNITYTHTQLNLITLN